MTESKKPSTSRKSSAPKKKAAPKAEAPEVPVEEAPVEEAPVEEAPVEEAPVEEAPVEAAEAVEVETRESAAGRTAEEWIALSKVHLGVKPWIVRAAVADQAPGKKYTEGEIRRLIRRKLSEPV